MPAATSTNALHETYMNFMLRGGAFTPPTSLWLALFTTTPQLDGTGGVEVTTSGTGYARQEIVCSPTGSSEWTGPSGANREYVNAADIEYAVPTASWGTVTGAGLFTQVTGGTLYWVATLQTPKVVSLGDGAPRVLAGQLRISRATCP